MNTKIRSNYALIASDLALAIIQAWAEDLASEGLARKALTSLTDLDGDFSEEIDRACALIAGKLLGPGWAFAHGHEAAVSVDLTKALDLTAEWPCEMNIADIDVETIELAETADIDESATAESFVYVNPRFSGHTLPPQSSARTCPDCGATTALGATCGCH